MADPTEKWEDNIPGNATIDGKTVSFYVDKECILCSVCSDAAPNNFRMSERCAQSQPPPLALSRRTHSWNHPRPRSTLIGT